MELVGDNVVVYGLCFSGHQTNVSNPQRKPWADLWLAEMVEAIQTVQRYSEESRLPLCFLGYSLSCVVFLNAYANMSVSFDRIVLLAPPLTMRWSYRFIEIMARLGLTKLPSLNLPQFRVHRFLPLSYYCGLFQLVRKLEGRQDLPKSVIIIMDPGDRMVDIQALKIWIARRRLRWPIIPLITGEKLFGTIRHLVTVKSNIGEASYKLLRSLIRGFFFGEGFDESQLKLDLTRESGDE